MADSDKLGLGLDDIIRNDRSSNRRGGRGGGGNKRGFRGRGTSGRGGGQTNGFRARGGGGLVNIFIFISSIHIFYINFSLEHQMHQLVVGNMIFIVIIPIKLEVYNEIVV